MMKEIKLPIYQLNHYGVIRLPDEVRAQYSEWSCELSIGNDGRSIVISLRRGETYLPSSGTLLIPTAMLAETGITRYVTLQEREGHYVLTPASAMDDGPHPDDASVADSGKWFDYFFDEEKLSFPEVCTIHNEFIFAEKFEDYGDWENFRRKVEERLVMTYLSKLKIKKYPT